MDAALRTAEVLVSPAPDEEWQSAFLYPPGPVRVLPELRLVGDTVWFTFETDDDLACGLRDIDARIAAANLAVG
jgi:hypothetical protein